MSRAGIFGWSYPPGCSGPPEYEEQPCQMCGEYEDKCTCPECPVVTPVPGDPERVCGTVGCLEHMSIQTLFAQLQHYEYLALGRQHEFTRREWEAGPNCEYCGTKCRADLREGSTAWCENCKGLALKSEREPDPWGGDGEPGPLLEN